MLPALSGEEAESVGPYPAARGGTLGTWSWAAARRRVASGLRSYPAVVWGRAWPASCWAVERSVTSSSSPIQVPQSSGS